VTLPDLQFDELAFVLQMALAFGGGIVAFLSPCVLPMLPGYLGLMSGYSVADLAAGRASRGRMLRVTLLFVLGFSAVFVATGAIATRLSQFLNSNQMVLNRVAGAVVIAFGLVVVGMAFTNRGVFGVLARERRADVRPSRLGAWAPPVMGLAFGFGWTPCIGPILTGVLAVAATRETVLQGMLLLLSFSLGLGVPFVAAGLGLARAFRAVKALRRFIRPINVASGVVMTVFGVLLFTGTLPRLAGFFVDVFTNVPLLEFLAEI
jgi:cytochrome c-type biogenesis protein